MVSSLILNSHFFAFFGKEFLKLTCLVAVLPGYGNVIVTKILVLFLANSICNIHEFNSLLSLYIHM
jgi:hypothetical protein